MPDGIPKDYQEILNQLHSNVFLNRLKNHMESDGRSDLNENETSDLIELSRRLQMQDASSSIDGKAVEMLLEDEDLFQAICTLIKSQSKEA